MFEQLGNACCAAPFDWLGPQGDRLRAWQPGADRLWLLSEGRRLEMTRVDAAGGFELALDSVPADYRLLAEQGGKQWQYEDPYACGDAALAGVAGLDPDPAEQYRQLGAQPRRARRGERTLEGVRFAVYAPHARAVSLVGDFNRWDGRRHPLHRLEDGHWVLFVPGLQPGQRYKFELKGPQGECLPHKADPLGFHAEQYPSFASLIFDHGRYQWQDQAWRQRQEVPHHQRPVSVYEVHAGSWRRHADDRPLGYRELADELVGYVAEQGFTHLELLPVAEHPFTGSWGYQPVGLFAPTSRFGAPDDFKYLVDRAHQAGVGVIIDWVPAHFPEDGHGLAWFDGTPLYQYADPRLGWHPDWRSLIYDFGRDQVRRFLVANALYWFEHFHVDGLRVDAVASMLYRDYSRPAGEWLPNVDGGNHNYEAISLLQWVNHEVYHRFPGAMMIAEESTSFPGVSRPVDWGGLGFGFKWNMGWMHDSLHYLREDPLHRRHHHDRITFPMVYAFSENFMLSLSHDEVVHGKGSLLDKMPGDDWQRHANLRAYLGFLYGQPGKKLLFMGAELAQRREWDHEGQLSWERLAEPEGAGMQRLVRDLNRLYREQAALHQQDCDPAGFEWLVADDREHSVLAFERRGLAGERLLVISNFTPVPRDGYRLPVRRPGRYRLLFNSDRSCYGGSDYPLAPEAEAGDGFHLNLPPLATLIWQWQG